MSSLTSELVAKLAVGGYVREHAEGMQTLRNYDHALFQNIPPLVASIIVQFYFINVHFDIAGKGVTISDDGLCITIDHGTWENSTYSTPILSTLKKICKWDLKIHNAGSFGSDGSYLMVGISPSIHTDSYFIGGLKGPRYGYAGWNGRKNDETSPQIWSGQYGDPYQKGDTVSIELDLMNGKIIFYKNGKSQGVAYENIQQDDNIEYRLAISMGSTFSKIEMIDYCERFQ